MTITKTIASEVNEDVFTIHLLDNGIAEVVFNPSLEQIDTVHLVALKKSLRKIGNGKKLPIYLNVAAFLNITPEGRAYSASVEAQTFTLANAVLVDNLAKRIGFNFFLNFNKPQVPTKAFPTKDEAFEWLLSLKD